MERVNVRLFPYFLGNDKILREKEWQLTGYHLVRKFDRKNHDARVLLLYSKAILQAIYREEHPGLWFKIWGKGKHG